MRLDPDPADLTSDERLREVADLLATGLLRLRDRHVLVDGDSAENLSKSQQNQLANSPDASVTVSPR